MAKKIFIIAKPSAKNEQIVRIDETHFRVSVKAPPDEGKANIAIVVALHKYFGLPKSYFSIIRGHKSKNKTIVIQS